MVVEKKGASPKEASPKDPLHEESSSETRQQMLQRHHHYQQPPLLQPSPAIVVPGAPFISPPPLFESVNPKRPKYGSQNTTTTTSSSTTGQWKLLPSPNSQPKHIMIPLPPHPPPPDTPQEIPEHSSSNTASTDSPIPSHSAASGQDTNKPSTESEQHRFHQLRRGKYVSPVWKPNEMLWLARAWRVQYQGGGTETSPFHPSKGKTRAEKDKEVAEFLNRQGVKRDAKTAGTKWDNMLGEFRKVYEWERNSATSFNEKERSESQQQPQLQLQGGKSYFRLSPYERKLHRLPASFDEDVFDELSQFMGSRMRTGTSTTITTSTRSATVFTKTLALPAPPLREDFELSHSARARQLACGGDQVPAYQPTSTNTVLDLSKLEHNPQLQRIGKVRMIWEESVTLWGDQQNNQLGRVKIEGSSFLNADELTFFDESMLACSLEAFEDGPFKGLSVDKFHSGQQVKLFGRRKSSSLAPSSSGGFPERFQIPLAEPSIRSNPPWEFQDPTEYYVGCLKAPPSTLPTLFELSWHLQEPPPEDLRFPLRKDVYRDLPLGKELFFTSSSEPLDCRSITYDLLCPILRQNPTIVGATVTSRESLIGLWDDCINRVVTRFSPTEMVVIRKPSLSSTLDDSSLQDQWPNVTGFVRSLCLWRGEEIDQLRDDDDQSGNDPSSSIVEKLLWTYNDLPYILAYYAIGYIVTFCALSRSQDETIIRTDLYSLDLSIPTDRLRAMIPCWKIAGLLHLLADRCVNNKLPAFSDFERLDVGNGNVVEITPNTTTRLFSSKRRWREAKEIYDFLEHRIPHSEYIVGSSEKELALVLKPRGYKRKPKNTMELIDALKCITKALVALHDLSFMHRDLSWEKVMKMGNEENETRNESGNEWFVCGFEEAVGAPQIYKPSPESGRHAPEMERGIMHGVKVDVWGVGELVRTSAVVGLPKMLRELQSKCLDQNPEIRPTAADCYHHLLQLSASVGGY